MPNLVGTGLNQVPTNSMLGGMAYQDPEHASIKNLDLKNLSQINSEIADTAVDIFVYDTRKDSDGGDWRKRTQHTSWYNETLGTATRGTRREFPSVAVIVATASNVTIYDGDDPDLPMWMVFTKGTGAEVHWLAADNSASVASGTISALNGTITSGVPGGSGRLTWANFISDEGYNMVHVGKFKFHGGVANRNDNLGWNQITSTIAIVNRQVNDIAMTVLPNAPIDDATGLPIPTIAVATDGGTSVIKDDGSVVDLTGFAPVSTIHIDSNSVIGSVDTSGNDYLYKTSIPTADVVYNTDITAGSTNYYMSSTSSSPTIPILRDRNVSATAYNSKDDTLYRGGNNGLDVIKTGQAVSNTVSNPLITYLTSDYNTGYLHGDIKGAFLSDTDATNITGTELWPEGDFADANEWSSAAAQWTISGGTATVNYSGGGYSFLGSSTGTLTNGKKYVLSFTISNYGAGGRLEAAQANAGNIPIGFSANGSYSQLITYTGTTGSGLGMYAYGGGTVNFTLDNLYLRELEEEDRSINNTGLAVYGTLTKTAVATGAELVAYSGWSASNYLQQPYNSDFLFGTSDFCITGWVNNTSPSNSVYEDIITFGNVGLVGYPTMEPGNWFIQMNKEYGFNMYYRTDAGISAGGWSNYNAGSNFQKYSLNGLGVWYKITIVKSGDRIYSYANDDLLGSNSIVGSFTTSSNLNDMKLTVGYEGGNSYGPYIAQYSKMALWRISRSAPSEEQVRKMYNDEKHLFQENAKATLYGSSDVVTALDYDEVTDQLHVGTSAGRSDFQGLRRINNTTTAVTTAISAYDTFIIEQ